MAVKVVEDWLNACSGCEISILNIGDPLLDILPALEFVHITALVDHKFFGQLGDGVTMDIPEAVVGIVSGGVRNEEQKHELEEIRKKVKFLISLGSCACHGGVPAQANMWKNDEVFEKVFRHCVSSTPAPHPDWIAEAISALLAGKTAWSLPERSVCDTCPVIREQKSGGGPVKRWLQNMEFNPEEGLEKMRCINEQGFLCMGPVTLAGCAGKTGVPRCIQARTPCRGCFGPIRKGARPMVEM